MYRLILPHVRFLTAPYEHLTRRAVGIKTLDILTSCETNIGTVQSPQEPRSHASEQCTVTTHEPLSIPPTNRNNVPRIWPPSSASRALSSHYCHHEHAIPYGYDCRRRVLGRKPDSHDFRPATAVFSWWAELEPLSDWLECAGESEGGEFQFQVCLSYSQKRKVE
jgi:hypothetical protein